jgi:hypothetical protein
MSVSVFDRLSPEELRNVARAQEIFRSAVVDLKDRFRKGRSPRAPQRLVLAHGLREASKQLFASTAQVCLPRLSTFDRAKFLEALIKRITAQASNDWYELGRHYRPMRFDIRELVREALATMAHELEKDVCQKVLLDAKVAEFDNEQASASQGHEPAPAEPVGGRPSEKSYSQPNGAAQSQVSATSVTPVGGGSDVNPRSTDKKANFPKRAAWLQEQLLVRGWSKGDLKSYEGPSEKTTDKILCGEKVGNSILKRLADALSKFEGLHVDVRDIPKD